MASASVEMNAAAAQAGNRGQTPSAHPEHPRVESSPLSREPLGLLAGSGRFPVVVAEQLQSLGHSLVTVGIKDHAPVELKRLSQRFYWAGVAKLGRIIRCFKRAGVRRVLMAGKIRKNVIFTPWKVITLLPDWRTIRFWFSRKRRDNKDDSLLLGIIDEFRKDGMDFDSALTYCPDLLIPPGVLTRRKPNRSEQADIAFGWLLAKEMGRLDVGQSVMVKEKAVLAVEAIEGTDQAIARAGALCRYGGFTVVKVAKPQQDMRFDVPTIGPETIANIHRAGGTVLAVEAGKTILVDRVHTIQLADRHGIALVAIEGPPAV